MRIDFFTKDSEKTSELLSIVKAEMKKHFMDSDIEFIPHKAFPTANDNYFVSVGISNSAYFWDVYKAKEKLYKEKGNLEDFVSDVEENLSFVCDRILVS